MGERGGAGRGGAGHAVVAQGLAKFAEEMAGGLDGARPKPEKVLLYAMDRVLHEGPPRRQTGPAR